MNQQERKYITKRITTEEEAALARLAAVKLTTLEPSKAFDQALKELTPDQVMGLVLASAPTTKKAAGESLVAKIYGGRYRYTGGEWNQDGGLDCVQFTLNLNLGKNGQLPTGASYAGFDKLRKDEIAQREKVKNQIQRTAERCRDRAMLGDGTAALAALDQFVELINELAPVE